MRAVIYNGVGELTVEDRPVPHLGPTDVLVKNMRAGICGTDISAYTKGGADLGIFPGNLIGHEFVSQIVEVGSDVKDPRIAPGLRVFVNASTSKRGDDGRTKLEITDSAGGLSQCITVEDAEIGYNLHPLADNVSFDQAVVIEPFSVGNHGVNLAQPKVGERALVFGAGAVGLGVLANLRAKGIEEVIVSDVVPARLAVVKQLGGIPVDGRDVDPIAFARERFGTIPNFLGDERPDVDMYFDSAGSPNVLPDYLRGGKPGSRMVVLALPQRTLEVPQTQFVLSELTVIGSTAYTNDDIAEVVAYLAAEKYDPTPVVTHHFPQEQVVDAFITAIEKKDETIKVVIDVHP
ncbi:zinc-dependent alcohol dehydrogenase [Nesterenkonia sp. CF4.4]|uniref:zinc-dependent alcohol dehydrogenase n=1 Tax=Nesterenkonia sp. CF4.4 TaxID=3373079 RepID=UPI003EE764BC